DDCYEKILRRLDVFMKETEPLLDYYRARSKLISVDASNDIERVREDAIRALSKLRDLKRAHHPTYRGV
ncbi:MAG: hypothetical protein NZ992_03745, partial [Candidatus Korarchaeum sp.]|nr:hypothetical protein [Candidatus Korarchaeum sp.]MDW8035454.1 hypothetical protein [Candidatus Korarchaeum sp.]